jgi:hypothetical protein
MEYIPTALELYISNLLIGKGIQCIWDLNIDSLATAFNIRIKYYPGETALIKKGKRIYVFVNKTLSEQEQYEEFLHELTHQIMEHCSVLHLDVNQWHHIELKTDHLMQYVAIPYFLLDTLTKLETVEAASEYFYISRSLAWKRMENIKDRINK